MSKSNPDNPPQPYHSFLVRLWQEEPDGWRSQVEHIQTGQSYQLTALEALLPLIHKTIESDVWLCWESENSL